MSKNLSFYKLISNLKKPKSYTGKLFLIAFIGTHIPLISILVYLIFLTPIEGRVSVLIITLIATLVGTGLTLFFIYKLLTPVLVAAEALNRYQTKKEVPNLPKSFSDEAGILLKNTQDCIEELDELLKFKSRIIAIASHDSKTPLSSITIASKAINNELEKENPNHDEMVFYNDIIAQSTRNHSEFLNNMLDIAKFDHGDVEIHKVKVEPTELFEVLKLNHQFYLKAKNITLSMNSSLSADEKLYIDKDKMMSVLNNLVQNSIKFSEKGGVIKLNFERAENMHLIQVEDSGVGISDEKKKRLFDVFSKSSKGTKGETGTGLGLWISKLFTNLQGGTISFESRVDEGTIFTISIPINE